MYLKTSIFKHNNNMQRDGDQKKVLKNNSIAAYYILCKLYLADSLAPFM